ncbi:hypothetical protein LSAT2_031226 [Lamellibrachia satsuma]|nr:hypothetical protein LSAT2_031226 [Lamellibrachia satsuma]
MLIMVIAWIILVVLSSTLPAGGTDVEDCIDMCEFSFTKCIISKCPTRPWPILVPQQCLDERIECFEVCLTFRPG